MIAVRCDKCRKTFFVAEEERAAVKVCPYCRAEIVEEPLGGEIQFVGQSPEGEAKGADKTAAENFILKPTKDNSGYIVVKGKNKKVAGIVIPDTFQGKPIVEIEEMAFCNERNAWKHLMSIVIGGKVKSIGQSAFYLCRGLVNVVIPESVKTIGGGAFECCDNLPSIEIPDGVTSIGEYAFNGCSGLKRVVVGGKVASVGRMAFNGCDSLEEVYYRSGMPITIADGNDCLSKATKYAYSESEPKWGGNYWHYVDGVATKG